MRARWLILVVFGLAGCGSSRGGADAGRTPGTPANLAGDLAFVVGNASVGSQGPDNLTLLFQERGADGCLPAGARSVAITLQVRDHTALLPGSYAFGNLDGGHDGGSTDAGSGDGGASDGGPDAGSDAGPDVQVSALFSDEDAGLIDLRAGSGSVTANAVDLSATGAGNSGSFRLQFLYPDGRSHTLNGAYDLSRYCQ